MLKGLLKRVRQDDGFTLIELMVVVLIIGILVAIALPTFLGARSRAQDRAAQSDLRNAVAAAKVHFTDNDTYVGFNAARAEALEPAGTYGDAATTTLGTVAISGATATEILLQTESASSVGFCLADTNTGMVYGQVAAGANFADVAACIAAQDW